MFEIRNPSSGAVFLIEKLDYERFPTVSIKVSVSDGENQVTEDVTINIVDTNDEWPVFHREIYQTSYREDVPIGTTIFRDVRIRDFDSTNSVLNVTCINNADPQLPRIERPCDMFRIETISANNFEWHGHVVLRNNLDFEKKRMYQIPVQASDGENIETKSMEVQVLDVQDSPPVFTGSLTTIIDEGIPIGSFVIRVTAVDGDAENRQIRYTIENNPGNFFRIDQNTGEISTNREIDREDPLLREGFVNLIVKASEVDENGETSNNPLTFQTTNVRVNIRDLNDRAPEFDPSRYTVTIREDIANGTPLPGLNINVMDPDQGNNAMFELILNNFQDTFEVFPLSGSQSTTANIRVKNTDLIDYEKGPRQYELHVIARETDTPERRQGNAYITVNVEDVNDNRPEFPQKTYNADVSEKAPGGTQVITVTARDKDTGNPATGLQYNLIGNGADKFRIDPTSGRITVAPCSNPGSNPCIDYEVTKTYSLTVLAESFDGSGTSISVPLQINVLDENDNSPRFPLNTYVEYIDEGDTSFDPRLIVEATDKDSPRNNNNVLRYEIISGNNNNPFRIDQNTGEIIPNRPVRYSETPNGQGYFLLTVRASDPSSSDTTTVRINVVDVNDNTPVFNPSFYQKTIGEDTPPGTLVEVVLASDNDPKSSPNGQIKYRIRGGGDDKFVIGEDNGVISVAPGATFDFDQKSRYDMTVLAVDQGQPQRTGTATVRVDIRSSNNNAPYFLPSTIREETSENTPRGTLITTLTAIDPDDNANLVYTFENPRGVDPFNRQSDPNDVNNLFAINRNTGAVTVNGDLEREKVALYTVTVKATDTSGTDQTGTATLIVNILDFNSEPPEFVGPWTPNNPFYTIDVEEEKPVGSFVYTVVATDPKDSIREYKIISDPNNNFFINENTGIVTTLVPLDYEKERTARFVVEAIDDGNPRLTSTATINVNVININDGKPTFNQSRYDTSIPENSPGGTFVITAVATDTDSGDEGIIRYQIDDPRFTINEVTGVITVKDGAELDRERTPTVVVTVTAYDNPSDPDDRQFSSVPLYITLLDENDNVPEFVPPNYEVVVPESTPPGNTVIKITATDRDIGSNGEVTYFKVGGDTQDIFDINPTNGNIFIKPGKDLDGITGLYNVTFGATDNGQPPNIKYTNVVFRFSDDNNNPPVWVIPGTNNETVSILEEQVQGMTVTQVRANDPDSGNNGRITYGFIVNGQYSTATDDFNINPITGVITALKVFDRETKDLYNVLLVARDGGNPSLETQRFLNIRILDIDDQDPEFPTYQNCCTIPYRFSVAENMAGAQFVGQVEAIDMDVGQNANIRYAIESGNDRGAFWIDPISGILYANKTLDHEEQNLYTLTIKATNIGSGGSVSQGKPGCVCSDQSVVQVLIDVKDMDDIPPIFTETIYNACVDYRAAIGTIVTRVQAGVTGIVYTMEKIQVTNPASSTTDDVPINTFTIQSNNGTLFTNALMTPYRRNYFRLDVRATNGGGLTAEGDIRVFVTEPSKEVVIVRDKPKAETERNIDELIEFLQEETDGGIVCINRITAHVDDNGNVDFDQTDIYIHIIGGGTLTPEEPDVIYKIVLIPGYRFKTRSTGINIAAVGTGDSFSGFSIDPLLAALIALLLLLLLALLFLICWCCCCPCCGCCGDDESVYSQKQVIPLIANGGTVNPLWMTNELEDQELKMNVTEYEADGKIPVYTNLGYSEEAKLQIKPATTTTTRTETTREYQYNYNSQSQAEALQAADEMDGPVPRIEAELEPDTSTLGAGSTRQLIYTEKFAVQSNPSGRSIPVIPTVSHGVQHSSDMSNGGYFTTGRTSQQSQIGATVVDGSFVDIRTPDSVFGANGGVSYDPQFNYGSLNGSFDQNGTWSTNMRTTHLNGNDTLGHVSVQEEMGYPQASVYQGEIILGTHGRRQQPYNGQQEYYAAERFEYRTHTDA